ncbi:Random slug protein 5 [Diplonema papillatum]|nr:Random slug protein 5 [Diplonema papillatum]
MNLLRSEEAFRQAYASPGLIDAQVKSGLTEQERHAFEKVEKEAQTWAITDESRAWLTESTYCRYLRARNWDAEKAGKMLHATCKWREQTKAHEITFAEVKSQLDSLATLAYGYDCVGHPLVYMRIRRDPPGTAQQKMNGILFYIETALRNMDRHQELFKGVEKFTYIVDLQGFTMANSSRDTIVAKEWTGVLSNHCPERLHRAYLINYPSVFKWFFKLIQVFIDPVTKAKVRWVPHGDAECHRNYFESEGVPPGWLDDEYGGGAPTPSGFADVEANFFRKVRPESSPYAWALVAGALAVAAAGLWPEPAGPEEHGRHRHHSHVRRQSVQSANHGSLEFSDAEFFSLCSETTRVEPLSDDDRTSNGDDRGNDDIVVEQHPVKPAAMTLSVRRPRDGPVVIVEVDESTRVGRVIELTAPSNIPARRLVLVNEDNVLSKTDSVYHLAAVKGLVLELEVPPRCACSVM